MRNDNLFGIYTDTYRGVINTDKISSIEVIQAINCDDDDSPEDVTWCLMIFMDGGDDIFVETFDGPHDQDEDLREKAYDAMRSLLNAMWHDNRYVTAKVPSCTWRSVKAPVKTDRYGSRSWVGERP